MPETSKGAQSPVSLSLTAASIIGGSNLIITLLHGHTLLYGLIITVVTFGISFFVYFYFLKNFIQRKVKLIYKLINKTKSTRKEKFFEERVLPPKDLYEAEMDVMRWAAEKRSEIETLKVNEQFRKEFLMNLAHELRTPIFTVQGYIHTLLDGAMDDPNVSKRFLENASKGVERLVQLSTDIEQISALESNKTPIEKTNFSIHELVEDVYNELSLKAEEKKVALLFDSYEPKQLYVFADRPKIKQVLINLVENAIKYGKISGYVKAEFWEMENHSVYIEISDDGHGIEEQHLNRIWERFYRTDWSRSSKIGGTGLGLAIVKHIVEAHHQTINVRSKKSVGSSFGFTLEKGKR